MYRNDIDKTYDVFGHVLCYFISRFYFNFTFQRIVSFFFLFLLYWIAWFWFLIPIVSRVDVIRCWLRWQITDVEISTLIWFPLWLFYDYTFTLKRFDARIWENFRPKWGFSLSTYATWVRLYCAFGRFSPSMHT